jgi:hypothetical protein
VSEHYWDNPDNQTPVIKDGSTDRDPLALILTELKAINQTMQLLAQAFKAPNAKPANTKDIFGYGEDK